MVTVRLQTSDQKIFTVDFASVKSWTPIREACEHFGPSEREDTPILLENVDSFTFSKVYEWALHHKDDPILTDEEMHAIRLQDISEWDAVFLQVDSETLFSYIRAANYLDMKGLVHMCCNKAASLIRYKSVEQIRETFGIQNDLTPEEEEQIRRENDLFKEQ